MTATLTNPHDAFFKQYFSQPAVASDFLRQHLPIAVREVLDLGQLRLEKDSFVDEQLRSYFSDLIYTTVTQRGTPVRVALLAEHKSYPDEWVAFQVLRYQVGYWVQEFEALQAAEAKQRAVAPATRYKRRKTLTPILTVLVYHGAEEWQVPLRFAQHLTGLEDPNAELSRVLGCYVPDFEPHFVNLATLADDAIRGEVTTRMLVTVLKYIFTEELGGQLDAVLQLASEVLRQPSGLAMVMALLRYIGSAARQVDKAALTQKLLTYLPHEGGVLMATLAQEWIQEGIDIGEKRGIDIGEKRGIDIGEKRGIDIGEKRGIEQGKLTAQRQTLLHLLDWRFALTDADKEQYVAHLAQIDNVDSLLQLVDLLLTNPARPQFDQQLRARLPAPATPG